jgi:nucleotide-binding universal stress UspA family protein
MFDHLLVPLDGSPLAECVLPHAIAIAQAFGSRISLLRVLEECRTGESLLVDPLDWQMWKAEGDAYLGELADGIKELGIEATATLLDGQAAERILEYAREEDVDLILVSSHGWSGMSPWNVGSVVQKIVLRSHTSTLIVRAYELPGEEMAPLRYRRILVPLDGSARAEVVLSPLNTLARHSGAEVMLAHVVRLPEMPSREPLSQEDIQLIDRMVERNREQGRDYLEGVRERLDLDAATHLLSGDSAAIMLHEFVEQNDVDLVVMGAHGRSGGDRTLYGSVTMHFIANGTSPLLIVQDLSPDEVGPTRAEISSREQKGH